MRGGWGGGPQGAWITTASPLVQAGGRCIRTQGGSPTPLYPAGSPLTPKGPPERAAGGSQGRISPRHPHFPPVHEQQARCGFFFKNEGVIPGPRDAPPGALRGAPCAALNAACSPHGAPEPAPPTPEEPRAPGRPSPCTPVPGNAASEVGESWVCGEGPLALRDRGQGALGRARVRTLAQGRRGSPAASACPTPAAGALLSPAGTFQNMYANSWRTEAALGWPVSRGARRGHRVGPRRPLLCETKAADPRCPTAPRGSASSSDLPRQGQRSALWAEGWGVQN